MAGEYKDLQMPPVLGGPGSPALTPPGQKTLELPPVIGGDATSMGMPMEKALTLPPTVG